MAVKVSTLTMERDYANTLVSKKEATITGLTKKLRTANLWKWGAVSTATYVIIRVTITKSL